MNSAGVSAFFDSLYPDILSIKELTVNKPFRIFEAERANTKYGQRILLHTKECQIYLPEKYNAMRDEMLDVINDSKCFDLFKISKNDGKTYKLKLLESEEVNLLTEPYYAQVY